MRSCAVERKACQGSTKAARGDQSDSDQAHLKCKEDEQTSVPSATCSHVDGQQVSAVTIQLHHVLAKPFLSSVEMPPFCPCRAFRCVDNAESGLNLTKAERLQHIAILLQLSTSLQPGTQPGLVTCCLYIHSARDPPLTDATYACNMDACSMIRLAGQHT